MSRVTFTAPFLASDRIVERLQNSRNGNPRFRVTLNGIEYTTSSDSMCNYEVENVWRSWWRDDESRPESLRVTLTGRGTICAFEVAS